VRGRRVTLSAGAMHSPALLMRSGIGPRDELAPLRIECRITSSEVDRPAGELAGRLYPEHDPLALERSASETLRAVRPSVP
jgi:5-(hydroxymethyl)furfural/furfural oxidase